MSYSPKPGLFTFNGRDLVVTFVLVTSLFLLWGFCNGLIDVLNKHFQSALKISKAESGFVQFANYIAYFLMAVPAGLLARRFGYKGGILIGLVLIALGAFWFIPATSIGAFWAFLLGIFILATGLTCLETIANPYATVLGPPEKGALRINIAQSCNGIGWMLGPVVGGSLIFGHAEAAGSNAGLYLPYLGIGIVVSILIVVFFFASVPDIHAVEVTASKAGDAPAKPLIQRPHFTLAVVAQFFYVAAQSGIFGFFINYVLESRPGTSEVTASHWLGLYAFGFFLTGRLCGSAILSFVQAHKVLGLFASINIGLTVLTIFGQGNVGLFALYGTFFFMSIMFPTIFALGIHGLGEQTKLASSIIVMAIVGGALIPPLMGWIADVTNMRFGFFIPVLCFAVVALYALVWRKLLPGEAGQHSNMIPVSA